MTRNEAEQYLKGLGIEEPSKENIDSLLNTINGAVSKEKDSSKYYKSEADKSAERLLELQSQLDAINEANLSDIEKANKATNDALDKVALLEKQIQTLNLKNSLADKGITGDNADKLIESITTGSFDVEVLGNIIASASETAVQNKVNELATNAGSPNAGTTSQGSDLSLAEQMVSKMQGSNNNDSGNDVLANYL